MSSTKAGRSTSTAGGLSAHHKEFLLGLARDSLTACLTSGEAASPESTDATLLEPRATFVTLRTRETGDLRGCRGETAARWPLIESVVRMAVASATDDPRFESVTLDEIPSIHIEISVLTPMHRIAPSDVVVGRHGLLIMKGAKSGLLLPQAATANRWDRDQFLKFLCRKAGISGNPWNAPDTSLYAFEVEMWEEARTTNE